MTTTAYYWKIRELAVTARTTVAEVCREAGISHTTVWRWKTGDSQPTTRTWDKIVAAAEAIKQRAA